MKRNHSPLSSTHAIWICAGLALKLVALAGCTYTVPPTEGDGTESCNGSSGTQGAPCLTNAGLVLRYLLAEAASGTEPTQVKDSASKPLHLALDYGTTSNLSYTQTASGRGLHWNAEGASGTAFAAVDGTKVYDALHGKTRATIEVVAEFIAVTGDSSRIFTVGMGPEAGRFSLTSNNIGRVQFRWLNDIIAGEWPVDLLNLHRGVLHVVVDTTDATDANRMRLYVNGALVPGNTAAVTPKDSPIDIGPGRSLYLGNREGAVRSFAGSLYYAALYDRALSDTEVQQNAEYLMAKDDR